MEGWASGAEWEKVRRAFFADGQLLKLPVKQGKRLLVLAFFAERFAPGQEYAEAQVNARVLECFEDYCVIRRELVDWGFMAREDGVYRRLRPDGWLPER